MDRKLDAWIADNIFEGERVKVDTMLTLCPEYEMQPKEYTSDMNEAVKVLQKTGCCLEVDGNAWLCNNYHEINHPTGYSDNPAMAICFAAYKLNTGEDWYVSGSNDT